MPLIGFLSRHGQLNYFLLGWAGLICAVTALYLAAKQRGSSLTIQT